MSLSVIFMKTEVTQYFDLQFMGCTIVDKLVENLKSSFAKLNSRKLLQISMDGPRVNSKVLSLLCEDREKQDTVVTYAYPRLFCRDIILLLKW